MAMYAASTTTEPADRATDEHRRLLHVTHHARCFACGDPAPSAPGLGLRPAWSDAHAESIAEWRAPAWATSYDGVVHGGLIATLLDAMMVHALFARGLAARTASLRIRYRHPVLTTAPCLLRARLVGSRGPLRRLSATLHQAGRLCARAEADFLPPPSP